MTLKKRFNDTIGLYKIIFSEYGQIKGNKAYNNMLANDMLLHTPLPPWGGGGSNSIFFFSESSSVEHYGSLTLCTP